MAVIIDNRSDISGIGKLGDLGIESPLKALARLKDQAAGLFSGKKKAAAAPAQATPVSADAPAASTAPAYVPTWKDKVAEQWSKPAVKAGVGAVGVLAAYLAWKKWKK